MSRILVTGAGSGLGLGATRELVDQGHTVMAHVRAAHRANGLRDLLKRGAELVVADLTELDETRDLAMQVEELGGVDAMIHNAGTMDESVALPVNVVAPYMLSALIPAQRLVYLSSSMHRGGRPGLDGLDWSRSSTTSYSDSKLLVTVLAAAVARVRPYVFSNAVDPGWVPTDMGGPGAPDDLQLGHHTQVWLAVGKDPATHVSAYWHHQKRVQPHPSAHDENLQDALLAALTAHTKVELG